jgi:hypothetical protein
MKVLTIDVTHPQTVSITVRTIWMMVLMTHSTVSTIMLQIFTGPSRYRRPAWSERQAAELVEGTSAGSTHASGRNGRVVGVPGTPSAISDTGHIALHTPLPRN